MTEAVKCPRKVKTQMCLHSALLFLDPPQWHGGSGLHWQVGNVERCQDSFPTSSLGNPAWLAVLLVLAQTVWGSLVGSAGDATVFPEKNPT